MRILAETLVHGLATALTGVAHAAPARGNLMLVQLSKEPFLPPARAAPHRSSSAGQCVQSQDASVVLLRRLAARGAPHPSSAGRAPCRLLLALALREAGRTWRHLVSDCLFICIDHIAHVNIPSMFGDLSAQRILDSQGGLAQANKK